MPEVVLFKKFNKRTNSTKIPDEFTARHVHVDFKGACSLINPVFLLTDFDAEFNYMRWGTRYYWMENVTYQNRNVVEVSYRLDVLASWRTDILNSTQYVLRSSSAHNDKIIDSMYPSTSDIVTYESFPPDQTFWHPPTQYNEFRYIISTIGADEASTYVSPIKGRNFYMLTTSQLQAFLNYITEGVEEYLNVPTEEMSDTLLKCLYNPFQYITSIKCFPINMGTNEGVPNERIRFGYWSKSGVLGHPFSTPTWEFENTIVIHHHPEMSSKGVYLHYQPFSTYVLHCDPFGDFTLDNSLIDPIDSIIKLHFRVDLITGDAQMEVKSADGAHIDTFWYDEYMLNKPTICRANANVAVDIPISGVQTDYIKSTTTALNQVSGIAKTALTGGVLTTIASTASGVADFADTLMPNIQSTGAYGSFLTATNSKNIRITERFLKIVNTDNEDLGRPLCEKRKISTLSGYCLVRDCDIATHATAEEIDQIKNLMNGGFFIE